jgi:hypothetical protein
MTTRQTLITRMRDFAWLIGIAGGIAGATGFQYVSGGTRLTALENRVGTGLSALETRVVALEGQADIMQALALDLCLRTTDPRIRAPLECFRREAGQRVP